MGLFGGRSRADLLVGCREHLFGAALKAWPGGSLGAQRDGLVGSGREVEGVGAVEAFLQGGVPRP